LKPLNILLQGKHNILFAFFKGQPKEKIYKQAKKKLLMKEKPSAKRKKAIFAQEEFEWLCDIYNIPRTLKKELWKLCIEKPLIKEVPKSAALYFEVVHLMLKCKKGNQPLNLQQMSRTLKGYAGKFTVKELIEVNKRLKIFSNQEIQKPSHQKKKRKYSNKRIMPTKKRMPH
jgi:hypothetical protein